MKKRKLKHGQIVRDVFITLVVTLLTEKILNVSDFVVNAVASLGDNLVEKLINSTYSMAASINEVVLNETYASLIFMVAITCLVGIFKIIKNQLNVERKNAVETNDIKDENEEKNVGKIIEMKLPEVKNDDKEINDENLKCPHVTRKVVKIFLISYFVFLVFLSYFQIYAPTRIYSAFISDITLIKPYLDQSDIYLLESDWVRMNGKEDYDKIYEIIDNVKETNNLPNKKFF